MIFKNAQVTALGLETGWLRDVDAACDPSTVVAEVTVEFSAGEFFQHTYIDNYNVYDLSAWLSGQAGAYGSMMLWAMGDMDISFQTEGDYLLWGNHAMDQWTQGATQNKVQMVVL